MAPSDTSVLWVRFPPVWDQITPLREFVESYAIGRLGEQRGSNAGLAVHELLENAVKYGDLMANVELDVSFHETSSSLVIRVSNHARPARIRVLERELARIDDYGGTEAFSSAIDRLKHLPEGFSMLGLARVATVAALDIETRGTRVSAIARFGNFPPHLRSSTIPEAP